MTNEDNTLARHRLSRAHQAFAEGEHLLANAAPTGAINRFYYAAFYAARALLATLRMDSARHSGLISLFQKHFVKTNLISPDNAKALSRSFEKRQKSDYGDFATVTLEEAQKVRNEVQTFVAECENVLSRLTADT